MGYGQISFQHSPAEVEKKLGAGITAKIRTDYF
jgi:hypothetical protein